MRLLADENVHSAVVRYLREKDYQVEFIAESSAGVSDEAILSRPDISECILVTYDSDFGELIFKHAMPAPKVLIYSRLGRAEPRFVAERIVEIIERPPEAGNCYVISRDGIRIRPFSSESMIDG